MSDSGKKQGIIYLGTAEAAKRMGVSLKSVRRMCNRGELAGAFQEWENGPWHIPPEAVEAWIEASRVTAVEHKEDKRLAPPTWWRKSRLVSWALNHKLSCTGLITIVGVLAALISAGADIGGFRRQLHDWRMIRDFPAAGQDEALIVIATFAGLEDTEAHQKIYQAIKNAGREIDPANIRVEMESTLLETDDEIGARKLGKWYGASTVIWGSESLTDVTVNFLSLRQRAFETVEAYLYEDQSTRIRMYTDPDPYVRYITEYLPGQLTFLSLFAIGHSLAFEESYEDGIKVLEKAISSLPPGTKPPERLAEAHYYLGLCEIFTLGSDSPAEAPAKAKTDLENAISLKPDFAKAHVALGLVLMMQGDLQGAVDEFDRAIRANSALADAYINRGIVRGLQGDLEEAISDYDTAIEIDPGSAVAFGNRAGARAAQGDFRDAIAELDRAIEIDPSFAEFYFYRGNIFAQLA